MKIAFVDNFFYTRFGPRIEVEISPHLGLMSLAAVLREAGHEPAIIDPKQIFRDGRHAYPDEAFYQDWVEACLALDPEAVGFTAYGRSLPSVIRTARALRARAPALPILIGGPHATIVGPALLQAFDCFDIVVRHEAEGMICALFDALEHGGDLGSIANLVFRGPQGLVETGRDPDLVDMDSLPYPALDLYPDAAVRSAEMSLEAGRGCPFACTFCSTANFFKRRYRLKSNDRLIAEMERSRARYGASVFNLNHDLFGLNKKSLREFCDLAAGRGFIWKCSMRSDTLDTDMLEALRAAGCRDIYFGIETGSPRLQDIIKKRLDLDETKRAVSRVVAAGLSCTVSFITGFEEESETDQDATLDLIGWFLALDPALLRAQLHILSPEPGSELGDAGRPLSFDGVGPEADDIDQPELVRAHPELFSVFFHYPSLLPRWRVVLASALVTSLVPQIGVRTLHHLLQGQFDGRLSLLFAALFPAAPDIALTDHAAIETALWSGLERVVARLAERAPYLEDVLRLRRVIARMKACAIDKNQHEVANVWIVRFKSDILDIEGKVGGEMGEGANPAPVENALPPADWAAGDCEFWFLLRMEPGQSVEAFRLDGVRANDILEGVGADSAQMAKAFETDQFLQLM